MQYDYMDPQEKESLDTFIEIQIGKDAAKMPDEEKAKMLEGRFKRIYLFLFLNLGIVLFFGYSFYFEITELSNWVFTAILIFFSVNILLLLLQYRKLKRAISWLKTGNPNYR